MNKYLVKVAGRFSQGFSKAMDFGENVFGGRARQLAHEADILAKNEALGRSARDVHNLASSAAKQTRDARVKAGLGVAGIGSAGFLGIHKYHQHQDRAIMDRLNRMYDEVDAAQQQ
jgi:hypothetical protein